MLLLESKKTISTSGKYCTLILSQQSNGAHQDFEMPEIFMPQLSIKELWLIAENEPSNVIYYLINVINVLNFFEILKFLCNLVFFKARN